jgi:proteasome lid subunit RPN8/RPN11
MLSLQRATVAEILRWAAQHPDVEVCGLVWQSGRRQVVYPLTNVHPDPARYYRTDVEEMRTAYELMDRELGTPIAYYHSHPGGKGEPSEEDMLGAFSPEMHYLIAYPRGGEWRLSTWECLEPQILVAAEVEVVR